MKKTIIGLVVMAMATVTLTAQEQDRDRIQDQDRTKLLVVNGEMLQLRDRAELHLREKQVLADGTVLYPNGRYVTPDGKKYRLGNGECLDGDGALYRNEYQYRYKVQQELAGLTQAQMRERNQNRIHYTFMDGDVYLIRNQEQRRLETAMQLQNGATVFPDGGYQFQDRQRQRLENGQCIGLDGEMQRNMYQLRKHMMKQIRMPAKSMMKKGVPGPKVKTKKTT